MKSILLASASVFAFAGAAAADGHSGVSFGGDATIGFNDVVEDGFFFDSGLSVTMSAALDNNLTASATFGIDLTDDGDTDLASSADWLLTLESDMAILRFGNVAPVGDDLWSGVDGSAVAGFNDYDVHIDTAGFEAILRGDVMLGSLLGGNANADLAVSFGVDVEGGNDLTGDSIDAAQAVLSGSFGNFGLIAAFQQEFGPTPQIIAVAGTASFFGADLKLAYEDDGTESSIGGSASYPIGPVTVGGYFTENEIAGSAFGVNADFVSGPFAVNVFYDVEAGEDAGEGQVGADASYTLAMFPLTIFAGAEQDLGPADTTLYYGAAEYDLGGGASILVSYADDGSAGPVNDEVGGPEFNEGLTGQVSFEF